MEWRQYAYLDLSFGCHPRDCRMAEPVAWSRAAAYGLLGDMVVGILVGAFVGGWLAGVLHISIGGGFIASIITATIGAVILIVVLRLIKSA